MAEHDGTPNGYVPARHPARDEDSWHDAADERTEAGTDDEFADLDEIDARYLRTLATPSYDLGPQTDSFVVDLTAAESAASRHSMSFEQDVTGETEPVPAAQASMPSAAQGSLPNASTEPPIARPGIAPEPAFPPPATPHTATPSFDITPAAQPPATEFVIPPVPVGTSVLGAESLTAATVLKHRRARPQSGWRKRVYSVTGGKINFGLSRADRRRADLIERARTPVGGCYRLAVISLKGGVGKTTTTAALGAMFADLRGDRVVALDANPDRGTLAERAPRESGATVRHLLAARGDLHRYADVRAFTSQSPTRLEVLASDSDPHVSHAFSEDDYRDTVAILERFYNLVLTDCGTGLLHDAMRGILGLANSLVVVELGQSRRGTFGQRDARLAGGPRARGTRQERGRRHLLGPSRRRHRRRTPARRPLRVALPRRRDDPLRPAPRVRWRARHQRARAGDGRRLPRARRRRRRRFRDPLKSAPHRRRCGRGHGRAAHTIG